MSTVTKANDTIIYRPPKDRKIDPHVESVVETDGNRATIYLGTTIGLALATPPSAFVPQSRLKLGLDCAGQPQTIDGTGMCISI